MGQTNFQPVQIQYKSSSSLFDLCPIKFLFLSSFMRLNGFLLNAVDFPPFLSSERRAPGHGWAAQEEQPLLGPAHGAGVARQDEDAQAPLRRGRAPGQRHAPGTEKKAWKDALVPTRSERCVELYGRKLHPSR